MKKPIPIEELGRLYGVAQERMQETITNYCEDLYTSEGAPRTDPGQISRAVDSLISKLRHEASLIKDASYEYFESNADKSQEELF